MKSLRALLLAVVATLFATNLYGADAALLPQRVLYIGHRSSDFEPFLKTHFAKVESVSRQEFQQAQAKDFDVVMLDWPQSGNMEGAWRAGAPLGKREEWTKPTILLGSAGLNLAVTWKLKGGSGCTCLAPVAYALREHEIFQKPIAINIKATTNIPTPDDFSQEIKEPTVAVLPLVDNIRNYHTVINDYQRGWSTHYFEFADMPEVEIFCGGINEQTPRSAAFWRQGNLLHFGFEQSPSELNETGRAMLVNAVVYISRFTEDRPIDVTPSVFGPEKIGISRKRVSNYLTNADAHSSWATSELSAVTVASFDSQDRSKAKAWLDANAKWLHPGPGNLLEVDQEAKSLGTPFDAPDFLPKTIQALRDDRTQKTAATLLARYVADGPDAGSGADAWEKWWRDNSAFAFYSELGCYRWYIDPLAKRRGIPTKSLRGVARADLALNRPTP
jgi:hypothetical protein